MENAAHLRRRYSDVELVLSCGDMPAAYLEFITSVLNVPLFYVRGNHDTHYDTNPPGGEDLHMRILEYRGISFCGLEGSMRYNSTAIQYTDAEMRWNVLKLSVPLKLRQVQRGGCAVDILVTHSPPKGIHDLEDRPHHGFKAFNTFIEWFNPRYLLHGHIHIYDNRMTTKTISRNTTVLNITPVRVLEIEPLGSEVANRATSDASSASGASAG
jgi:Icc-related predicted phosphoesterase